MIGLSLLAAAAFALQDGGAARVLVATGLSGEPQYATAFATLGAAVVDAAKKRWGVSDSGVVYLAENPSVDPGRITGKSTREAIQAVLARFAAGTDAHDVIVIVLAGHGSEQADSPRLNLPGPDLTAADLAASLAAFRRQTLVIVNAASASGGFLKPLAGSRRIVVTATKSGFERNATMFGSFFAAALSSEAADADKNGRISVAEAYQYARREVIRSYETGNRLLTEHSQIDDNGDGIGSAEPTPAGDGALARLVSFGLTVEPPSTDPKVAALVVERRRLETAIASLRGRKQTMDSTSYERELERLLIQLAETNRAVRAAEAKP